MAKIALLGDSYISRLEEFCKGDLRVPGDVRFFGVGGMNFDNYSKVFKEVKLFRPDAVYISEVKRLYNLFLQNFTCLF